MKDDTLAIRGHEFTDSYGTLIPPIYLSTVFEQRGEAKKSDRNVDLKYSREENPTVRYLEKVLAKLEGYDDALAFSSGMSAISSLYFHYLSSGDEAVITCEAYGTTIKLLQSFQKYGIKVKAVLPNEDEIVSSVTKETKFVFIESMSNPTLKVLDFDKIRDGIKEKALLIMDNTFLSPALFKPSEHGAKVVVESLTKYISGHNDVVGGMVAADKQTVLDLWEVRKMLGSIMNPFNAYLTLRGVKTLSTRLKSHQENALKVAKYLISNPKVKSVHYPCLEEDKYFDLAKKYFKGCGGVVSFEIKGGYKEAVKVLNSLKLITPSPSLGGTESIMTYPVLSASSPISDECKKKVGITPSLLRLSVGLEDPEDIINDLEQALREI